MAERLHVSQAGAISPLVDMLGDPSEMEALMATGCLGVLAANSTSNQEDIVLSGGLTDIAFLMTSPWPAVSECALALMANLA
eukprot:scaffold179912_cov20-Prasinocladus_malaysianus.AAC.1